MGTMWKKSEDLGADIKSECAGGDVLRRLGTRNKHTCVYTAVRRWRNDTHDDTQLRHHRRLARAPIASAHAPHGASGRSLADRRVPPVCARGGGACSTRPDTRVPGPKPSPLLSLARRRRCTLGATHSTYAQRLPQRIAHCWPHAPLLPSLTSIICQRPQSFTSCALSPSFLLVRVCSHTLIRSGRYLLHESSNT